MLSVGIICFEDRYCASRKGGIVGGGWLLQLAVEKNWLDPPFLHRKKPFHLVGAQFLVL